MKKILAITCLLLISSTVFAASAEDEELSRKIVVATKLAEGARCDKNLDLSVFDVFEDLEGNVIVMLAESSTEENGGEGGFGIEYTRNVFFKNAPEANKIQMTECEKL